MSQTDLSFVLPLQFNKREYSVIDANRRVVCPCMIYKGDRAHIDQQTRTGIEIVNRVNNFYGWFEDDQGQWKMLKDIAESVPMPVVAGEPVVVNASQEPAKRKRGRPRKNAI